MTKAKFQSIIKRHVSEWMVRMRLLDKDVVLVFPDGDPGYFAITEAVPAYQSARISFRHPDHHPPQIETSCALDEEVTVVHELLHVASMNLHPAIQKAFDGDSQWEAFIERTAQALVSAKRGEERYGV